MQYLVKTDFIIIEVDGIWLNNT